MSKQGINVPFFRLVYICTLKGYDYSLYLQGIFVPRKCMISHFFNVEIY